MTTGLSTALTEAARTIDLHGLPEAEAIAALIRSFPQLVA